MTTTPATVHRGRLRSGRALFLGAAVAAAVVACFTLAGALVGQAIAARQPQVITISASSAREQTAAFTVTAAAVTTVQVTGVSQSGIDCLNNSPTVPLYSVAPTASDTSTGKGPFCTDSTCGHGGRIVLPVQKLYLRTSAGTASVRCGVLDGGAVYAQLGGGGGGGVDPADFIPRDAAGTAIEGTNWNAGLTLYEVDSATTPEDFGFIAPGWFLANEGDPTSFGTSCSGSDGSYVCMNAYGTSYSTPTMGQSTAGAAGIYLFGDTPGVPQTITWDNTSSGGLNIGREDGSVPTLRAGDPGEGILVEGQVIVDTIAGVARFAGVGGLGAVETVVQHTDGGNVRLDQEGLTSFGIDEQAHLSSTGTTTPAVAVGTCTGTTTVAYATDNHGSASNTACSSGQTMTVTFAVPYVNAPTCLCNATAASVATARICDVLTTTTTAITITPLSGSNTFTFQWLCIGRDF